MTRALKKLVIVESPAKAKTIEKFLGRGYAVKASLGHVRDLPKPPGVDVEHEFEPSYVVPKEKKEFVKELARRPATPPSCSWPPTPTAKEAIAWHLTQAIGTRARPVKARRIVFHEITRNAVQEALKHPRAIDGDLVNAQQARRVIDRLVGYKLSPCCGTRSRRASPPGGCSPSPCAWWWTGSGRSTPSRRRSTGRSRPSAQARGDQGLAGRARGLLLERNGERLELKDEAGATAAVEALNRATYSVGAVRKREASRGPSAPSSPAPCSRRPGGAWASPPSAP